MARSAVASLSWLLETHRNARIGSPIVAGSSNRSKSASSVGSFVANRGLPLPLRRTFRPSEPGSRKSFRPRPIVLRASFVTREAAAIPPYPAAFASAAAPNRRPRSSSEERPASYRMRRGDSSIIETILDAGREDRNPANNQNPYNSKPDSTVFGRRLSQLEGALLLARTYRGIEPMRCAEHAVKLRVRAPQFECKFLVVFKVPVPS